MITNTTMSLVSDIAEKNDDFYTKSAKCLSCTISAAITVTTSHQRPITSQMPVLSDLIAHVALKFPRAEHWLLVGDSCWQPDNRITRYRKLWKSFEAGHVHLPSGEKTDEFFVNDHRGIKFFGAIRQPELSATVMLNLFAAERCCTLICVDIKDITKIQDVLAKGWEKTDTFLPPLELLEFCCDSRAIAYSTIGSFDDVEAGIAVFGRPDVIDEIFSGET